jgi:hypothetical protein
MQRHMVCAVMGAITGDGGLVAVAHLAGYAV